MLRLLVRLQFFSSIALTLFAQRIYPCEETISTAQQQAIAQRIYLNECNGKSTCLVDWNPGESFASLGIGHFIWYPKGVNPGYVESFPLLVDYLKQQKIELPEWLTQTQPFDAPWPDRSHFLEQRNGAEANALRTFLLQHQTLQIAFMQIRMQQSLRNILDQLEPAQRQRVQHNIHLLCQSVAGHYALIDYVNFKGEGLSEGERINGQGWGLMQVLNQMQGSDSPADAIHQFALTADKVLTRRALNSPNPDLRTRWLEGWRKRLQTYEHFERP